MRFAINAHRHGVLVALLCAIVLFVPNIVAAQTAGPIPTDEEIAAAVERLRADPNLAEEREARTLRWKSDKTKKEPQESETGSFFAWIEGFFQWFAGLSRALMWVLGALLGVALIFFLARLFGNVQPLSRLVPIAVAPTHVRELDIRPESLPPDIGAAALELWNRREHRAALALLYRGLLSRLAHVHGVPIRDSTTEGDCLVLAKAHLQPTRSEFVARTVSVWQRATYGGQLPATDEVQALCSGFDAALSSHPAAGARSA